MLSTDLLSYNDFIYIAILLASFLLSFGLTPTMRRFATRVGVVDKPDGKRKFQKAPVAYLGGVAIVLSFLVVSTCVLTFFGAVTKTFAVIVIGTIAMAALGLVDDVVDMKSYVKFGGQVLIATLTVVFGGSIEYVEFFGKYISFGVLSAPLTVIWIVLVVNAVNMIDGLDGLACGISAFSLMAMFVSSLAKGDITSAVVCCALCGASLGFLPYNITPASIFMGDSGAMALGYVMAAVSVFGFAKGPALISLVIPALVLAVPVSDAVRLFFERIFKGRSPFSSDRLHIHHKLVDMGMTPRQAVLTLYVVSSVFGISAVLYIRYKTAAVIIALLAFAALLVLRFAPSLPKLKSRAERANIAEKEDEK
ncbi:MAG: undecaprenyl/decaprenyl-phosphate alpha-N-acetylglucosaminyl 1-phosphate transferase [Clostridia bacterium]|nr:undecaprenyl/decaprenyl-phosphate alpha-N-acetylglucosaminyl 1-phosphate transferase [Clostridia bacterium]